MLRTVRRRVPMVAIVILLGIIVVLWPPGSWDAPSPEGDAARPAPVPRTTADPAPAEVFPEDGEVSSGRLLMGALSAPALDGGRGDEALDAGGNAGGARAEMRAFLARNAADAERSVDRYCEATKGLKRLETPSPVDRHRDAAYYMGIRTDWEDGRIGLLHLAKSLTDRMNNPMYSWRNFGPADYAGLDFSWMHELEQFDSWSLSGDGPLKGDLTVSAAEAPIPNYVTMQNWVKLRLVKGANDGDLPTAIREVRHLGDLIASNGTLVSEMIRLAFQGIERGFLESRGIVPEDPPLSATQVSSLRFATFGGMFLLYPGVPRAVKEKALKCMPVRCSALSEAIAFTASVRDLVDDAAGDIEWLQQQSPCDPALARTVGRSPPIDPQRLGLIIPERLMGPGVSGIADSLRSLLDGGI
jgi:hypothetical protein